MPDLESDFRVFSNTWIATPDNYSSLRVLGFDEDGCGKLTYAYGQTIYIVVMCRWELSGENRLRITYTSGSQGVRSKLFKLDEGSRVKELQYRLLDAEVAGVEDIVAQPFSFRWMLELSEPPWPSGLELPYEIPRVFFGH
jgi:hypothetical protein